MKDLARCRNEKSGLVFTSVAHLLQGQAGISGPDHDHRRSACVKRIKIKYAAHEVEMGGGQNYGPLLGPLSTRCRIMVRTQKGTIILTATHIPSYCSNLQTAWREGTGDAFGLLSVRSGVGCSGVVI